MIIGIGLVAKEVEKRSIYSLLSRPVTREQFILGKYAGLVMTLAVNIGAMSLAYYLLLFYQQWTWPASQQAVLEAPVADPRLLIAARADLRRADGRDRGGVVLLDVRRDRSRRFC